MSGILKEAAEKVYDMTKGKTQIDKDKWWWNEKVQKTVREKKKVYKKLKDGTGNYEEYKRWKQKAKRAVAKAKESAWKEWYDNLGTKEGEDNTYKIAKARAKHKKNITHCDNLLLSHYHIAMKCCKTLVYVSCTMLNVARETAFGTFTNRLSAQR